ncbi:MAG: DUF6370 family protein [Rufibacter sp.]
MKTSLLFFALLLAAFTTFAQTNSKPAVTTSKQEVKGQVEAACGQCQFKMKGNGCDLAIRVNGQAYFVDGTDIDKHGDAHAKDGFCNAIRKATVQGEIIDNRFKATSFALVEAAPKKK